MHIQKKIKFLLHRRKKGVDKQLNVRMRVTIRGMQPIDFPLGYSIDADLWDGESQRVIGDDKNARDINRTIDEWRSIAEELFARYELVEKRVPKVNEFRDLFNDSIGRKTELIKLLDKENNLFFVYDRFTTQMSKQNNWTSATIEKFAALKNHLKDFSPECSINDVDDDYLRAFQTFLMSNCGMRNTTISKTIAFMRWFLRWSSINNYYQGKSHDSFRPKIKGVSGGAKEMIYCSKDEIKKLLDYDFSDMQGALERIRDVFLFQCFTGLRYSDVAKLRRSDVKSDSIRVVTKKTIDGLTIELNDYSRAIIDKYKDCNFHDNLALPVISNQKMNQGLKVLCQLVGLIEPTRIVYFRGNVRYEEVYPKWQLITTHTGRHTFIVTALMLKIPVEVVMKWTGHSSYQSMKPYIAIVDELKKDAMEQFNNIF